MAQGHGSSNRLVEPGSPPPAAALPGAAGRRDFYPAGPQVCDSDQKRGHRQDTEHGQAPLRSRPGRVYAFPAPVLWRRRVKSSSNRRIPPLQKAVDAWLPHARHVLDRFHVVRWFATGLDAVRRDVQRRPDGNTSVFDPEVFPSPVRFSSAGPTGSAPTKPPASNSSSSGGPASGPPGTPSPSSTALPRRGLPDRPRRAASPPAHRRPVPRVRHCHETTTLPSNTLQKNGNLKARPAPPPEPADRVDTYSHIPPPRPPRRSPLSPRGAARRRGGTAEHPALGPAPEVDRRPRPRAGRVHRYSQTQTTEGIRP